MTTNGWLQILAFSLVVLAATKPLGVDIAKVYDGSYRWLGSIERPVYRICGIEPEDDQHWTAYAAGLLVFSAVSMLVTYVALRAQGSLPLNPEHLPGVVSRQAFETAASFTTKKKVRSLLPLIKSRAVQRNISVVAEIDPALPRVSANQGTLRDALGLVLNDAITYAIAGTTVSIHLVAEGNSMAMIVNYGSPHSSNVDMALAQRLIRAQGGSVSNEGGATVVKLGYRPGSSYAVKSSD